MRLVTRWKRGSRWWGKICSCAKAARWRASSIFRRRSSPIRRNWSARTRSIVLGKKSGLDSVDLKAKELGLSITPEQRASILAEVKKRAIAKRGLVNDTEFREIVMSLSFVRLTGARRDARRRLGSKSSKLDVHRGSQFRSTWPAPTWACKRYLPGPL